MPLTRSLPKVCTGNMSRATADATEDAADMGKVTAMVTAKAIATERDITKADAAADMVRVTAMVTVKAIATERDITKADAAADMGKVTAMVTVKAIATERDITKEDAAAIIKNSGHVASARIHIGRIARPL